MMSQVVNTASQALAHLFFHFCKKDGGFDTAELDFIAGKFVHLGLRDSLDFKKEAASYQSYQSGITSDRNYIEELIRIIHPVNTLALFSWCIEIALSDGLLSSQEDRLLNELAKSLQLTDPYAAAIKKLMVERRVADTQGLF